MASFGELPPPQSTMSRLAGGAARRSQITTQTPVAPPWGVIVLCNPGHPDKLTQPLCKPEASLTASES